MEISVLQGGDLDIFSGLADLGKDKPKELWVAGRSRQIKLEDCAAVVGSRRMTGYGLKVVEILVKELIARGKLVVSGYMSGVDMAVHQKTMEFGGVGMGILGWGIRNQFSSSQIQTANKLHNDFAGELVAKGGLVLSEWELQVGTIWTFPRRNRLVAAMCAEVYVVEAAEDSGSLITADWAQKLDRKLFAVPGPVTSPTSVGTNQLIADGKAKIWIPAIKNDKSIDISRYIKFTDIYTMLQNDIVLLDEMVRTSGKSPEELATKLTQMELEGLVRRVGGKYELSE